MLIYTALIAIVALYLSYKLYAAPKRRSMLSLHRQFLRRRNVTRMHYMRAYPVLLSTQGDIR